MGMVFCRECSAKISDKAASCPKCGAPQLATHISKPKKKEVCIILAFFLSSLTWLYTYKYDYWKFWLAMGIGWVGGTLFILTFQIELFILVSLGIWIWALTDSIIKEEKLLAEYHKQQ